MTVIVTLIGDLGGGKTTLATFFNLWVAENNPDAPRISNVQIKVAVKVEDTNKMMAIKLMHEDKNYALVTTDEAAQAGFESRGSGSKSAALESRVITLARKAHVDLVLVSQLMCLPKGTLVETNKGDKPIETLTVGDTIVDHSYWGIKFKQIRAIRSMTARELIRIDTEDGHSIMATPTHRFPVNGVKDGEPAHGKNDVFAKELEQGDLLKVDKWRVPRLELDDFAVLLGIIHAEGNFRISQGMRKTNQLTIAIDKREAELRAFVIRTILKYRPSTHIAVKESKTTNQLRIMLSASDDVQYFLAAYEHIVKNKPDERLMRSFLCGFFEGDGHVSKNHQITLTQSESNYFKLKTGMDFLTWLQIPYTMYFGRPNVGGIAKEYAKKKAYGVYRLNIASSYSNVFANTIGFISQRKQSRVLSMSRNIYARISETSLVKGDFEVYDIQVEGRTAKGTWRNKSPYFMANGVRTHNSMIDKRAQWLSNIYILCEAIWESDNETVLPSYFEYTVYNNRLEEIDAFELDFQDCVKYIFDYMDTDDIPFFETLKKQWKQYYEITDEDEERFRDIMAGCERDKELAPVPQDVS